MDAAHWTGNGAGTPPTVEWAGATESRLTHLVYAREAAETVVADDAGGLTVFDPAGRLRQMTRGLPQIGCLAVADVGGAIAVAYDERRVAWLEESLATRWSLSLYDTVTGLAFDPFGRYLAIALANRDVQVYTADRGKAASFEAVRPLRFLAFSATQPQLIGAADHGLLGAWTPGGKPLWDTRLWTTCGDMAASGDGQTLFVAAFAHGVQRFDGEGTNRGTIIVEGTPGRLATSFDAGRLSVATLEHQLYRLDAHGNLLWRATAPDDIAAIQSDGPGERLLVGLASGRMLCLRW